MKLKHLPVLVALALLAGLSSCRSPVVPSKVVNQALHGHEGAFVLVDCATGQTSEFGSLPASRRLVPCSTFKIWNTLIGLESGILESADQPFYQWDGIQREIPTWNQNLTLKDAFQASCVPAFQDLARKIGPLRMNLWIDKIGYGNRDTSAGIDVFWLPAPGRKTILISPKEQARLMAQIADGDSRFSPLSLAILKDIMVARKTERGTLYGKTGTGHISPGSVNIGWFVGYVEGQNPTQAFACVIKGRKVMGKDARSIVETILENSGRL